MLAGLRSAETVTEWCARGYTTEPPCDPLYDLY